MSIAKLISVRRWHPRKLLLRTMSLLHQSSIASRDSVVIGQHILYACGMSARLRRTGSLTSRGASSIVEEWRREDTESDEKSPQDAGSARGKSAAKKNVSASCGKHPGGAHSTFARHEAR